MDATQQQKLTAPFPQAQVKQRQGHNGGTLDYLEGHTVIERLNEAFEGEWDFQVLKHMIMDQTDEVAVLGRLTAGTVTKSQFGSSPITRKQTGQAVSIGSDLKAAATDALKKCATLLGIGLYLYSGKDQGASTTASAERRTDALEAVTERQQAFILNLAQGQALSREQLDRISQDAFGVPVVDMTKTQASSFIEMLRSRSLAPALPVARMPRQARAS